MAVAVLVATAWAVVPAGSKVFTRDQARQALDVASQELNKAKC